MRRLIVGVLALLAAGPAIAESRSRPVRADLRLSWRPTAPCAQALVVYDSRPPESLRGAYIGPLYIEGESAGFLHRLPRGIRRSMAAPVGPTPLMVPEGAGLGLYVRISG